MSSLIIGAGGFVGKHLYNCLSSRGKEVHRTFLQSELEQLKDTKNCYCVNIENKQELNYMLTDAKPTEVYYLTAQASVAKSWEDPQNTIHINTIGFVNLMETYRKLEIKPRTLVVGSGEEYGIVSENDNPIDEQTPLNPSNPYSISKYAQELFGNMYIRAFGMNILQVRSFNHMGPGQREGFVVSDFAKKIVMIEKGLANPILSVGNLSAKRDFTDVRDIVRAYAALMECGKLGQIYNVGSGKVYAISEILDILQKLSSSDLEIHVDPQKLRPVDVPVIQCNNRKLQNDTDWKPEIMIEQTLQDVLDHYRKTI